MQPTPYSTRLAIFREFGRESAPIPASRCVGHASNPIARSILVSDVNATMAYRETADPMNEATAAAWFPQTDPSFVLQTVDADRDFIYTAAGLRLLTNRYLFEREPVQFGMLRIAMNLARREPELTKIVYDLLSCGFIHVSSIVAAADHVRSKAIKPGEACRLLVAKDGYDHELVSQIERISELISLGVGVGYGVSNLPLTGKTQRGLIRSGFMSLVERLNAANHISLHERKPKIALYLHAHNDTVNLALTIKKPSRINKINNVFIGLMIPNHFMECVRYDRDWYLFPGDLTLDGKNLADFTGARYVEEYERRVALELHTRKCRARDLMYEILQSLVETGSPYIIWSDHLNEFNNQKVHGTIKTLNLCAEITNYSNSENDSSCTLLSCNMAMYSDFPLVMDSLEERMGRLFGTRCPAQEFEHPTLARHAYILGYYGTVILNTFMGPARERREIGLNPLGVYDMALMAELEPSAVCETVSEALYRGGVTASCDEYARTGILCKMYPGSMFSLGRPQFSLRGVKPRSDWRSLTERMRLGMANSMLTSQAPTATTAMLTGATESVVIPISHFVAKESENGRNDFIPYGVMCRAMNALSMDELEHRGDLETQLSMYTASAPYVDHSQSVMISLNMNTAEIYQAIIATYKANLKTGIYYLVFKQAHTTINSVRDNTCSDCVL